MNEYQEEDFTKQMDITLENALKIIGSPNDRAILIKKYQNHLAYWADLRDNYYDSLTTYVMERDLNQFANFCNQIIASKKYQVNVTEFQRKLFDTYAKVADTTADESLLTELLEQYFIAFTDLQNQSKEKKVSCLAGEKVIHDFKNLINELSILAKKI